MPASKTGILSDAEINQRQDAPVKHGAFAKTMTPQKASRLAELQDQLSTRPGLLEVQKDMTAKAVEIANAMMGFVVQKHNAGIALDKIPTVNNLPRYMNAAQRALRQLHDMLPDDRDILNATSVLNAVKDGRKD